MTPVVKRRCLVCRMGDDVQKIEPLEVIAGTMNVLGDPDSMPAIRVPLCAMHKHVKPRVLQVYTGES